MDPIALNLKTAKDMLEKRHPDIPESDRKYASKLTSFTKALYTMHTTSRIWLSQPIFSPSTSTNIIDQLSALPLPEQRLFCDLLQTFHGTTPWFRDGSSHLSEYPLVWLFRMSAETLNEGMKGWGDFANAVNLTRNTWRRTKQAGGVDTAPEMAALGAFFEGLKEWGAGVGRYTAPVDRMSDEDVHRACAVHLLQVGPRADVDVLERGFAIVGETSRMWGERPDGWWFHKDCVMTILRGGNEKVSDKKDALFLLFKRVFGYADWAEIDRTAVKDGSTQFSSAVVALMVSPKRYLEVFRDGEEILRVLREKAEETRASHEKDGRTLFELKKLGEWLREME